MVGREKEEKEGASEDETWDCSGQSGLLTSVSLGWIRIDGRTVDRSKGGAQLGMGIDGIRITCFFFFLFRAPTDRSSGGTTHTD